MATHRLLNKVGRKGFRILQWPLRALNQAYQATASFIFHALTDKYWLLDYLPPRKNKKQTVLLVRFDLIGDFILWLDSAKELKNIYPNHHFILYANAVWAELAKQLCHWDEVVAIDVPRLRADDCYRIKILTGIRRRGFDIAISPTYSREYVGDIATRASGAKQRIGFFGDLNNISEAHKKTTDAWYSSLVQVSDNVQMELQRNSALIQHLGLSHFKSRIYELRVVCQLPKHLILSEPYIAVALGASWQPRGWPIASFADLVRLITASFNYKIVLFGTEKELPLAEKIKDFCQESIFVDLVGKTTLMQMVEITRGAKCLIGNESAAIHIAAVTRTPSVCMTGGGHFGRFMPYMLEADSPCSQPLSIAHKMSCFGCKWKCQFELAEGQAVPCIANIPVAEVFEAVASILNQPQDPYTI